MRLKEPGPVVKHERIAASLRAQIKRGDFKDRLPSRGALARSFRVNFKTIDKALVTLRKERLVLSRNGVGVFVHPATKSHVVRECFFVFPGHKALSDPTNPDRFLLAYTLEHLLSAAHVFNVELRFLPISPLNNREINWTLLKHLKKGDYTLFFGVQYWNVIEKLSRTGCRCLVFNDTPAHHGLVADGMSLMSVNLDYLEMTQTLVDYFMKCGCRHPAAVLVNSRMNKPKYHRLRLPFTNALARLCRRNGLAFSLEDGGELSKSDDDMADCLTRLFRETPPVDGIFSPKVENALQIRKVLDRRFPSISPSIRVIGFDNVCLRPGDHPCIDMVYKPYDEMIRRLMGVVCGKQPFEPGHVAFSACLETTGKVTGCRTPKLVNRKEESYAPKSCN